jgi:hypothetical protein
MWTVVQFALLRERDYRVAFDVLASCGFRAHRMPSRGDVRAYPAAVVADLAGDTASITRAAFERLAIAGLCPVAVMASSADVGCAANSPHALAQA